MARSCKHYGSRGKPTDGPDTRTRTNKPRGRKAAVRTSTKKNYKRAGAIKATQAEIAALS